VTRSARTGVMRTALDGEYGQVRAELGQGEEVAMAKSILWAGIVLTAIGATVFSLAVVPRLDGASIRLLMNGQYVGGLSPVAVLTAALALAAGFALIGIGLGRWHHPRPSHSDGSPEI